MKKELSVSVLLHSLPFLLLLLVGGGSGNGKLKDGEKEGEGEGGNRKMIVPAGQDEELTTVSVTILHKKPLRRPNNEDKPCTGTFYGGIGINHDLYTNQVTKVVKGYPAFKAGLLAGDILLLPPDKILGEPGTTLVIPFLRGNEQHSVTVTRAKICTSDS